MSIYTKSPRSVATRRFPSDVNVPAVPKLSDASSSNHQRPVTNQDLRRLSKFVSLWKLHALTHKNNTRKKHKSRPRSRAVLLNMRKNQNKSFDPESSVLSLLNTKHRAIPKENDEIPWYEQEEDDLLPWWEYPDLDEEDESTLMVRQVTTQKDLVYVNRVESLVWTAVIKLQNVAQFALAQKLQRKQKQAPTVPVRSRSPSPTQRVNSTRGQPHARVTVPTMFMGLPKEVQAEKRRFRKARESPSDDTLSPPPTAATVKQASAIHAKPEVAATPAPKRMITRKPAPLVEHETPTAWSRASAPVAPTKSRPRRTRSNAIDASALLVKATPPVKPTNARPRRMRSSTIANTAANTSQTTTSSSTMETVVTGAPTGSVNRRIQALKAKQQALKAEAQKRAQQAAETDAVQQRLEAQQKRLAKLRQKS